jgi:hypothetical protein
LANSNRHQALVIRKLMKEQNTICLKALKGKGKKQYGNTLSSFMRMMYLLQNHNETVLKDRKCWLLPVWGLVPNESAFKIDEFMHFSL